MKRLNKLASLLLAVSMVFSAVPAMAAEEVSNKDVIVNADNQGGSGNVPVTLNVGDKNNPDNPVLNFSVTVPTTLPIHVDGNGVVTVAGGANGPKIINRSSGPVIVKGIDIQSKNDWLLADWSANLLTEKVGTKKYALAIQGSSNLTTDVGVTVNSETSGTGDTSTFEQIPGKGAEAESSKAFAYNAHIAPQATDVTATIANVIFTIGWDEATPSGTESKVEDTYNDPDILKYDTDTETYVAKVDKPILVKANIYYGETEPTVALAALEEDSAGTYSMRKAAARATVPTYAWSVTDEAAAQIDTTDCTPGTAKVTMIKANAPIEINCKATIGNATLNAEPIKFKGWSDEPEIVPYLTFEEENGNSFTFQMSAKKWDGTLEYSLNNPESESSWIIYKDTCPLINIETGNKLYLRGKNKRFATGSYATSTIVFPNTKKIKCIGNVETLLDYEKVKNKEQPIMDSYTFCGLFKDCIALTKAPELPSMNLAANCYEQMFRGCKSLKQAPELPSDTISNSCYESMFRECSSLTEAPSLPATTLKNWCYRMMFYECTSLTTPPKLPATTLAIYCYHSMFSVCTSLTKIPEISAEILPGYCCQHMFNGCSLIKLIESDSPIGEYTNPYKIPSNKTGTSDSTALIDMFKNTAGDFKGTPTINKQYYLHSSNGIV